MATTGTSKLNTLYTHLPPGTPLTSEDLAGLGISADLAVHYVRAGWLTRLTRGVFCRPHDALALHPSLILLQRLCDAGYSVSLETSGALDISATDRRVSRVLDLKTPGSGEVRRNRYENIAELTGNDQVKFVLCSREDYDWAVSKLIEYRLDERAGEVLFSPSHHQLAPRELADWIVADNLPVRFQMQLHKILWNDEPGR